MQIEYNYGLVLKLQSAPIWVLPEGLDPIAKSHVTLIGGKALKAHKEAMKSNADKLTMDNWPNLEVTFGATGTATREDYDGTGETRITHFIEVSNQDTLRDIVEEICDMVGIKNPEPDRFFHLSLANNFGGNPFKSVGDITVADIE